MNRVFAAIFIALLAVNVSTQSPTLKETHLKDIVADAAEILLKVSSLALKLADDAVNYVNDNEDAIRDKLTAVAVFIGEKVDELFFDVIDKLSDEATDDGKAILKCLSIQHQSFDDVVRDIVKDWSVCVYKEEDKLLDTFKTILNQLKDVQNDVSELTVTLKSCATEDSVCITEYVQNLIKLFDQVPEIVKKDIEELIELIETVLDDVKSCGKDVVDDIKDSAQTIFDNTVVCIKS